MKSTSLLIVDLFVSIFAFILAVAVRYGDFQSHLSFPVILLYAAVPIALLYMMRFYANVIRIFQDESMRKVSVVLVICMALEELLIYFNFSENIPRAAPAIHILLLYIWLWNSRIVLNFLYARIMHPPILKEPKQSVLIYGVGNVAKDLIHVLHQSPEYQIVGVVDNRRELVGGRILGVDVYSDDNLLELISNLSVDHIFFVLPPEQRHLQNSLIKSLSDVSIKISEIPSLDEITSGKMKISDIKPVDVLDVLQRDMVEPDINLLGKNITNKVVMVTGAGGSIGSELCRQIIRQRPSFLVLFEISEFALYSIHSELKNTANQLMAEDPSRPAIQLAAYLGSVAHQEAVENICRKHQVQTIYHAAAYKHVPIVESNEYEGVMNNFIGTYRTVQAAINCNVETFVAISTDKAVRPTNIMGSTKRMAELACQAFATQQTTTTISMVRFGNVLGSSGSVVPLFNRQIAKGGPVTVTHPDITRYFMTIPEAAQLVIQAGAMAKGGEVFVLDMGDAVKIVDLAKRMIHLSGFKVKGEGANPDQGIAIEYVGLRPGEKLYEELIIGGDNIEKTTHERIMQAREHSFSKAEIDEFLQQAIDQYDHEQNVDWLKLQFEHFVEGYKDRPKQAIPLTNA